MDFIVHPGTGTIMASRECVWLPAHALEKVDPDDLEELEDAMDKHAVPTDGPIHIVSVGNAHDGITLFGPFITAEDAGDWATQNCVDDWQVVTPQTGIFW